MSELSNPEAYRIFLHLLRDARESAGVTQEQLANRLKETQSFVSKCERWERRLDVVDLLLFCAALNIDPLHFVEAVSKAIQGAPE